MNAYELSSLLETNHTKASVMEAADMLRQQADRIAELEEVNGRFADLIQSLREEVNKLREEILVWENAEVPTEVMADIIQELERKGFILTPQTKPLSDEEIIAVFESPFHPQATGKINDEVIAFARAIEERILGK